MTCRARPGRRRTGRRRGNFGGELRELEGACCPARPSPVLLRRSFYGAFLQRGIDAPLNRCEASVTSP